LNKYIVTEDGEVIDTIGNNDKILRGTSIDFLKELEGVPKDEHFTKLYHKVTPMLIESDLSAGCLIIFLYLATNLRYKSNVAKYGNGKLITRENIKNDLKLSISTLKRSIYKLIREGLIAEVRTIEGKVFIVNPYVVMVGDKINKTVFDLFRRSKWARW
jgi:hypothetical protein